MLVTFQSLNSSSSGSDSIIRQYYGKKRKATYEDRPFSDSKITLHQMTCQLAIEDRYLALFLQIQPTSKGAGPL